jgi:hypothetical protein
MPGTPVSSASYYARKKLYLIKTEARNLEGLVERVDEASTSNPGSNVVDREAESSVRNDASDSQQDSQDVDRGRRSEEASSECCFEDGTIGILSEAGNDASSVGDERFSTSKSSSQDSIERGHQSDEQESFKCSDEDGIVVIGTDDDDDNDDNDDDDDDDLEDDLEKLEDELERLASSVQVIQDEVALLHSISLFECCSEDGTIGTGTDDDDTDDLKDEFERLASYGQVLQDELALLHRITSSSMISKSDNNEQQDARVLLVDSTPSLDCTEKMTGGEAFFQNYTNLVQRSVRNIRSEDNAQESHRVEVKDKVKTENSSRPKIVIKADQLRKFAIANFCGRF